jgi:hypothetical protein
MEPNTVPKEPPPPYEADISQSSSKPTNLDVPHKTRNGIPPHSRRSMEDESRDLPTGWVRQYDSKTHHQFFVDTTADPPRPIWHHPYDDEQYMSSISLAERRRVEEMHKVPSEADIEAESSGDDEHAGPSDSHHHPKDLPPRSQNHGDAEIGATHRLGRKMKDKLTHSTHQERETSRRKREEAERQAFRQHQHIRIQMSKAAETGVPQLLGKDKDGKDVYIEPPGANYSGYGAQSYGYNPYSQGPYANPNATFLRPPAPYQRPYGYGYGGGYGMPLMGMGTGMLLGGLLF